MSGCVLCASNAIVNRQEGASRTIYNCPKCGVFVVSDLVEKEVERKSGEIGAYLMTRKLTKEADTVLISFEKANLDKSYLQMTVDRIVDFFPKTFSEQMDFALKNLGYMSGFPGQEIKVEDIGMAPAFYVKSKNAAALFFMMEALCQDGLVELNYYGGKGFPFGVTVSPKGWKRLEGFDSSEAARKNIFIYSPHAKDEISSQFYGAVEKAAGECGYHTVSHASEQSDAKVTFGLVSGVKSGQIVVCDLTEHARSSYYAAAMAQSLGKTCILTCHESDKKKLRFDTSQYHVIIWDKQETLYLEILNTIKAVI